MLSEYIHGYSEREQARLARMQSLLNARQLAAAAGAGPGPDSGVPEADTACAAARAFLPRRLP